MSISSSSVMKRRKFGRRSDFRLACVEERATTIKGVIKWMARDKDGSAIMQKARWICHQERATTIKSAIKWMARDKDGSAIVQKARWIALIYDGKPFDVARLVFQVKSTTYSLLHSRYPHDLVLRRLLEKLEGMMEATLDS